MGQVRLGEMYCFRWPLSKGKPDVYSFLWAINRVQRAPGEPHLVRLTWVEVSFFVPAAVL